MMILKEREFLKSCTIRSNLPVKINSGLIRVDELKPDKDLGKKVVKSLILGVIEKTCLASSCISSHRKENVKLNCRPQD